MLMEGTLASSLLAYRGAAVNDVEELRIVNKCLCKG